MSGGAPRRAAVLGHPVAHSLSPVLHRAAYAALGLDGWRYDRQDVTEEQLPGVVAGLDASWAGLSLTMPLKTAVMPLLDHVEPLAEVVGAVNTVLVQPGRTPVLVGANTDVHGVVAAVREGLRAGASGRGPDQGSGTGESPGERPVRNAVVLGAGATAASTLAALAQLGTTRATVWVRSLGRAGSTMRAAHRMGVEPQMRSIGDGEAMLASLLTADVVVSTLPPHAADPWAERLTELVAAGGPGDGPPGVLLDCAYEPRPTALQAVWAAAGGIAVGGERMLLHQATEQVRLMTGRTAPLAAMDAALTAALAAPPGGGAASVTEPAAG